MLSRNVRRNDDSDLVAAEEIDDRLLHLASVVAVVQQDVTASLDHREPILEVAAASIIGVVSIDEEHIEGPHIGRALALRVAHDELYVSAHFLGTKDLAQASVILGRDVDRVDEHGRVRARHQEQAAAVEAPDLEPGDWVVQNAANSGVGRSLIAIAKARGMKTINLVRRPELIPELQAVGGDLVVVDEDGALDKIRAAVGNGRVPLAIDGVAGKSSAMIAGALSEHGIFVVYAYMGGGPVAINPFDLIVKRIVVKGFFLNHPDIEPKIHAALRETVSLVASGAIQVPIAATYPLSSLREAVLHAQRGGKVLLDLRGTT